jgi:UDP-glucose 4-epimerase
MKIVVTGSDGFVGKNLVYRLKEEGHQVFPWDIKSGKDAFNMRQYKKVDVYYHLACINQMRAEEYPVISFGTDYLLALLIAEHAYRNDARFVFTSTASVYGIQEDLPITIDTSPSPKSVYAQHKLWAEDKIRKSDVDWTIFRLSNVYGPHQTTENPYCGVIGRFFDQAREGEPLTVIGDGMQSRDFTFVDDVVDWLAKPGLSGLFNVSHGVETPILSIARQVNEISGNTAGIKTIAERPGIDAIRRRVLAPDLPCFTDLETGLEKTWKWYKAQS